MELEEFREKILPAVDSFSKNNKRIAHFILANYADVPHMTARELAQGTKTSEAAIARFTRKLGFKNYHELRRCLRGDVFERFKGTERFADLEASQPEGEAVPLEQFIVREMENLNGLRKSLVKKDLLRAAHMLCEASQILIIGLRGSAPLAHRLNFGLGRLQKQTHCMTFMAPETYDYAMRLPKDGIIVVIAFPRYLAGMVAFVKNMREIGKKVIAITDCNVSLLFGDVTLYAPAVPSSFVSNHAAPQVLINCLLHAMANKMKDKTVAMLAEFEDWAKKYGYFITS